MRRNHPTYWSRILLSVIVVLFASCDEPTSPTQDSEALPAIVVPWTAQQSLVCFGTSLTYGFMWPESGRPTDIDPGRYYSQMPANQALTLGPAYAYPALLDSTLKIRVHNVGQVGATTQRALNIVADSVFSRNPALVLLEFGANDFLQHVSDSLVEQRLVRLIDTLQWFGSKVILISFLNPEMIASVPSDHFLADRKEEASVYLQMLRRIATIQGILFVEYAMRGIYWNTNMMSDELHPNQAGYRRMQENISRALVNTFQQNGMLK